jgi:PAS domain S-box-containing protein
LLTGIVFIAVTTALAIWPALGEQLLDTDFVPRVSTYAGRFAVLWTHVVADTLIALAYFAIAATLVYLVYRGRRSIPFDSICLAFGAFLIASGFTYLLSVLTLWVPVYVFSGTVKMITAVASITTAILLPFAVPRILNVVSAARAAQLTHDRLRMAMDSGKTVGWDWDVASGRDFMFGDLKSMFGVSANTYSGVVEDFRRRIHPGDRAQVWKAVNDAMQSHGPYAAEFRVVREDGGLRWVSARGSFYYAADGKPERMVGMAVDITDRRNAEDTARQKEMEFNEAQRLAELGSWQWDPETDTVTWSEELYRLAGRDPSLPAVSYKDHPSLYTPESFDRLRHCVEEAMRSGAPYELDLEMLQPNGGPTRWVTARGEVCRDSSGRIAGLRGTVLDITERKRAQDSLALFRRLIDGSNDAIQVIDPETRRFLDVNEKACLDLGYSREELLSMTADDITAGAQACDSSSQAQLHSAGSVVVEGIHRRKDGSTFPVEVGVREVHLDRKYKIAVVRDVSERKQVAEALEKSEESLRLAAEGSQLGVWDWNEIAQELTWDTTTREMFGAPKTGKVTLQTFYDALHPDDLERTKREWRHAFEAGLPYRIEMRALRADGRVRWIHARGRGYYDASGTPIRMTGVVLDITERKRAEESLSLFRKLIDDSNDGIEVIDPETFQFLDVNEKVCKVLGYSREELLSRTALDVDAAVAFDASLVARIKAEMERRGYAIFESRHRRKDGTTLPVEVNLKHVQLDRQYNVAIVRDISERKRAEEALLESEELLRLAVQAGKMFAYSWDVKSDKIVRSGESAEILGIDEHASLTGQQALAAVHPEDIEKLKSAIASLTPEKPYLQISYRVIRPNQKIIWMERNSCAHFDEQGKLVRMVGMIADATKRKLAEEALAGVSRKLIEAQEAERSRIARELHDDIGQRLALLSVTIQRASMASGPAELEGCLDELRREAGQVSADVQALSRHLHSATLEHLGMVAAMRGFCAELALQHEVEINFRHRDVPPDLPTDVSLCLFRVMQEGLHNAIKHSGVRRFEVEIYGTADTVELILHDDGVGFDPEAVATSPGLGLTSMRERLKLVDGELSICSKPEQGTTVHARAPFARVSDQLPVAG